MTADVLHAVLSGFWHFFLAIWKWCAVFGVLLLAPTIGYTVHKLFKGGV